MKIILPILLLAAATFIAGALYILKPDAVQTSPERPITNVEIVEVQPQTIRLTVRSQGTVLPKIESDLSAEVSGRIIYIAENFAAGARIQKGDVLLKIDPADYEAASAARKAELASAQLNLAQEEALAAQALADWDALGSGKPSELTLRKPQLTQARAQIESAETALARARRDLKRTEIEAPFDGRVLTKLVDLGQYIAASPASAVARIYATDTAEIRLPLSISETTFLEDPEKVKQTVRLFHQTAHNGQEWTGHLTRFEGTINTESRLIYAVAEVEDPFTTRSPMLRGLFVDAEIEGRELQRVYSLPRYALRDSNTVYVLTENGSLQTRKVGILKSDPERIIINEGLKPGEKVVTSPIAYFVENMPVEVVNAK